MRGIICLVFLSTLLAVVICRSPRRCTGDCEVCPQETCLCGYYKGECGCCDVCYKCRNEACHIVRGHVCETGYTCGDPNRNSIQKINQPAICIPRIEKP